MASPTLKSMKAEVAHALEHINIPSHLELVDDVEREFHARPRKKDASRRATPP